MTDYSSWTDEQVNEAIFKAKGWEKLPPPAFPEWQRPTKIGVGTWWFKNIPDYTHDWRLCGELLEEMQPFTILTKNEFGWQCSSRFGSTSHKETAGRAIAEQYLNFVAWKEQR